MIEQTANQLTEEEDLSETITIEKRHIERLRLMIVYSQGFLKYYENQPNCAWVKMVQAQLESAVNFTRIIQGMEDDSI